MGTKEHKEDAPLTISAAILTISSTRKIGQDKSGLWIAGQLKTLGHQVLDHQVVTDNIQAIIRAIDKIIRNTKPQIIFTNGGTGITPSDVTIEAVRPLFDKELTAFGALFAQLSHEEIKSAAILSRATAGVCGQTLIFCMPGSINACKLACNSLIFPELGHLVKHLHQD